MISSKQISYFRIGSFVITGIVLLVIAILIFGSGMLFKRVVYVETYFDESVQGLIEGSPVKYLGMQIGNVVEINSVENIYKLEQDVERKVYNQYIYVKMAISSKFFNNLSSSGISQRIKEDVASGLRFKLAPQGLTGNVYVELDYVDPKTQQLSVHWQPQNFYIPSTTSALTYFTDNLQYLLGELREVDFRKLFNNMQNAITSINNVSYKTSKLLAENNQQIINVINNLRDISQNLNALSEQARAFPSQTLFGKPPPPLNLGKL
jgi:ABC-type transporter Mla subunit MlaD